VEINLKEVRLPASIGVLDWRYKELIKDMEHNFQRVNTLPRVLHLINTTPGYTNNDKMLCTFLMGFMYRNLVAQNQMKSQQTQEEGDKNGQGSEGSEGTEASGQEDPVRDTDEGTGSKSD
jgi:hypothetical protein